MNSKRKVGDCYLWVSSGNVFVKERDRVKVKEKEIESSQLSQRTSDYDLLKVVRDGFKFKVRRV